MAQVIDSFTGRYRFLSNFFQVPVRDPDLISSMPDLVVPSSEHSYQARKGLTDEDRMYILQKWDPAKEGYVWRTPSETKKAWKKVKKREDWDEVKIQIMLEVVRLKFAPNSGLAAMLLSTGDAELVEGNWWNDTFWGVCNGFGQNHLGRILMHVREELRSGERKPYTPQ